jgi:hypothetical protein
VLLEYFEVTSTAGVSDVVNGQTVCCVSKLHVAVQARGVTCSLLFGQDDSAGLPKTGHDITDGWTAQHNAIQ